MVVVVVGRQQATCGCLPCEPLPRSQPARHMPTQWPASVLPVYPEHLIENVGRTSCTLVWVQIYIHVTIVMSCMGWGRAALERLCHLNVDVGCAAQLFPSSWVLQGYCVYG